MTKNVFGGLKWRRKRAQFYKKRLTEQKSFWPPILRHTLKDANLSFAKERLIDLIQCCNLEPMIAAEFIRDQHNKVYSDWFKEFRIASGSAYPLTSQKCESSFYSTHEREFARAFEDKTSKKHFYPRHSYSGRGIVAVGGGNYFPSVYVLIRVLRDNLSCNLPIELWYLNSSEITERQKSILSEYDVNLVNAADFLYKRNLEYELNGWSCKPLAIHHSQFEEVIFIDADNIPTIDPVEIFDWEDYKQNGALFWPDVVQKVDHGLPCYHSSPQMPPELRVWQLTSVPYSEYAPFETGQLVVNKKLQWNALNLTVWMNKNCDFWYNYVYGDKDTFRLAFEATKSQYHLIQKQPDVRDGTMFHKHDNDVVFQHRCGNKFSLENNKRVEGFRFENNCWSYLQELEDVLQT